MKSGKRAQVCIRLSETEVRVLGIRGPGQPPIALEVIRSRIQFGPQRWSDRTGDSPVTVVGELSGRRLRWHVVARFADHRVVARSPDRDTTETRRRLAP